MNRKAVLFTTAAMMLAVSAMAATVQHAHAATAKQTTKTLVGEVVDTGCYLGHAARGEKHVACATKCINGGMPMGLLTTGGTLYLLTMNHDNPDAYNKLKEMAGKTVSVTGEVMERSGLKGIDVQAFKPAVAAAAK